MSNFPETQIAPVLKKHSIPHAVAGMLSPLVKAYLEEDPAVREYYATPFQTGSLLGSIPGRKFSTAYRETLVRVLRRQYQDLAQDSMQAVRENLDLLEQKETYTVTTGHQLNIFTGPLYVLHKLASTINLAARLKEAKPECHFVPVYWMASEDHDFDEINHVNVYGRKFAWEQGQGGAAGRMTCHGFAALIDEIGKVIDKTPHAVKLLEDMRNAYADGQTLSEATRRFVHGLFGKYGLVILDPDEQELKKEFADVMIDDALEHSAFRNVSNTLSSLGEHYKVQVHPREINLFYLDKNFRGRIEKQGDGYAVLGHERKFTKTELESAIRQNPEHFSPNVVLRPLYQETVLPNLAVAGGPAEISYWLEYKAMFDHYGVAFPCLVLRGMALLLDRQVQNKMEKLGIAREDLFKPTDALVKEFIARHGDTDFFEEIRRNLATLFDSLAEKITAIDPTLKASAEGERQRAMKSVQALEEKAVKALKRKNETAVTQIEKLKASLFPGGVLQERVESFLPFYARHGQAFIDDLVEEMSPLEKQFLVFDME